jgi:hypothetical protein
MRRNPVAAFAVVVGILCLIAAAGVTKAAVTNVYWRVDLHQGTYIIAYGQGSTEALAWDDCFRLQAITRAMTAAETRRNAVSAISSPVVRWCQNPKRYATVAPDPVTPPPPSGTATLSWTPPTSNTDGTALTNLAGYRIHYGLSATEMTQTIQLANASVSSYTLSNLAPGTYYFAVRAYNSGGTESLNSNVVSKVVL